MEEEWTTENWVIGIETWRFHNCLRGALSSSLELKMLSTGRRGKAQGKELNSASKELSKSTLAKGEFKLYAIGTSLVAQWLRIRLPMQGTRARSLVQVDPVCCRSSKPVHHNYWSPRPLGPPCHNHWSPCAQSPCSMTREATAMRSLRTTAKSSPSSPHL